MLTTTPNRDAKHYNRLLLRCLATWWVVALGVTVVVGLGLSGMLIAIGWACGLGLITARYVDHRYPPPEPTAGPDDGRAGYRP